MAWMRTSINDEWPIFIGAKKHVNARKTAQPNANAHQNNNYEYIHMRQASMQAAEEIVRAAHRLRTHTQASIQTLFAIVAVAISRWLLRLKKN